jgi:acetyl esterase
VITAEIDPLRDEGERYADKLRSYGVPVVSRRYAGVTHEFFGMGAIVNESKEAVALAADELKKSLFLDFIPLQTAV